MLRVLVVEDDTVLADLLAKGLREHDMVVDVVHDGVQAVSRASDVTPDVIVLDRDLPILHGDDVTRALIRQGSPARVLMLTAAGSIDNRVEGLLLGADDYLAKPFAFSELIARVTALGRRGRCGYRTFYAVPTSTSTSADTRSAAVNGRSRSRAKSSAC